MATVNKDFRVKNNISIANTADTATTASHYIVETNSDGVIRPKTLANVRSEIVTSSAVSSVLDADLNAIAALAGTSGLLRKTAADTWSLDTTAYTTNTGTVTSVAMTVPTGLSISGTPITTSGTLALTISAGYEIPQSSAIVHIAGTETITGAKTFSSNLTMSSADILMGSTLGDRVTLWGTHDSTGAYAIGIENNTQYFKSGGNIFRWYLGVNADDGTSDKMELNSTGLTINGSLTATTKSFDIEHPTKENMRLRYGSLEGPENGVYVRGKSNSSIITLPDYWTGLVNEDSITVQLTSKGKHQNLYVEDIIDNTVKIGGVEGEFFYFIQAERKDVERLVVEY